MDTAAEKVAIDALNDKFWGIRQLAVKSFENYNGSAASAVDEKLKTWLYLIPDRMSVQKPLMYFRIEAIKITRSYLKKDCRTPLTL
jgi:hypothetical protein